MCKEKLAPTTRMNTNTRERGNLLNILFSPKACFEPRNKRSIYRDINIFLYNKSISVITCLSPTFMLLFYVVYRGERLFSVNLQVFAFLLQFPQVNVRKCTLSWFSSTFLFLLFSLLFHFLLLQRMLRLLP